MQKPKTYLIYFLFALTITACGVKQTHTNLPESNTNPTAEPRLPDTSISTQSAPTPSHTSLSKPTEPMPSPTEVPVSPKPTYVITATLNYINHTAVVTETLVYPNTSGETLSEFVLVIDANQYPGAFQLISIANQDGEAFNTFDLTGIQIKIPLANPLPPGEKLGLTLVYTLNIPPISTSKDYSPNPFGYTYRQINLVDWFPFAPPYVPKKGWVVHHPWYYGEHLVYPVADFEVTLKLERAPENTMVAASTIGHREGSLYQYHLEDGRNFVFSISHLYNLLEKTIGNTKIQGYVFPSDVKAGEAAFQATLDAFRLYSRLYGPYLQPSLTMVEADFDHGMEYQGLHYLSRAFFNLYDESPKGYLTAIAAHETAHQWWYAAVANDQAIEPWLDEALCTFSERLFYENIHPDALEWWQSVRIDYYQPEGWVNINIYDAGGYRPYVNAVYLRGAEFIQELRQKIGDDAFFAFLQDYLAQNRGKIASSKIFFSILREHTTKNLDELIGKYFSPSLFP